MKNLFNIPISNIRYGGRDVLYIKLGGDIIYDTATLYIHGFDANGDMIISGGEFTGTNARNVRTIVNNTHTNLGNMLNGCSNLISVNTEDWDTSNVTYMGYMFMSCSSLTKLNLSNFNTGKVTNMRMMFGSCTKLQSLDLSSFYTSKVTNMEQMFGGCTKLQVLYLSNFDTSSIDNYGTNHMFIRCDSLQELHLDNCSTDTINKIVTSLGFPTGTVNGKNRTLYCRKGNSYGVMLPTGWQFNHNI